MPAAAEESSAIRKLGRLFRLTEVHLWDDCYVPGASETHGWRAAQTGCAGSQTAKTRNRPAKQTDEDHSFVEDMELASLMGSLGLPVSFTTRKEKKNTPVKGKHQGIQAPYEAVGIVMQLNEVMLEQNSVDNESRMSCGELCQEGKLLTREDQISEETPSISSNMLT